MSLPFTELGQPYGVAVDAAGNVYATESVNDRVVELPVADTDLSLAQPANVRVNASGPSGATVTYATPAVTDESGDATAAAVACAPASGTTFATGITTVKCTATSADDTPSAMSTTFTVTVRPPAPAACTATITGNHPRVISVTSGTLCTGQCATLTHH